MMNTQNGPNESWSVGHGSNFIFKSKQKIQLPNKCLL